jgi:hypothetical protein
MVASTEFARNGGQSGAATESLGKTKLALRRYAIMASRPRRQGSAMNGRAKIARPPLTPLPARQALGGLRKRLLVIARNAVL